MAKTWVDVIYDDIWLVVLLGSVGKFTAVEDFE
jgi:hypothetical protein